MRREWIAALALALTACGGSSGGEKVATPGESASQAASPEVELETAYRTYIKAFLNGDGATAYELLSERCRDKEPLSEFAALSESAADLYGDVDYEVNSVTVDGNGGRVDATYAVEALNSGGGSLWVREDGEWHSDKCG